jgi:hypothetical protein
VAELLNRGCRLQGVPGFYLDQESGIWKLDIRASGIMIPDRNCRGEIEAVQIRLDKSYNAKFNLLTSAEKYYGATASCCPHFIGFNENTESVILTEGLMKADIAYCLSVELGCPRAFVGLTGVANANQYLRALEELKRFGVKKIKVAFDMDAFTNENVMQARERVLNKGYEAGFEMTPLRWNPSIKGIDDLMLSFKERRDLIDSVFEGG